MKDGAVLPALGETLSIASHRRARLSASSWNPTPVTSCTSTLAADWLSSPAHRAAGCSLLFIPRRDQPLWPALPATRTCVQINRAAAELWSLYLWLTSAAAHLPQAQCSVGLKGNCFKGFVGELLCHFWGITLKAASTNSPQDTFLHGAWRR